MALKVGSYKARLLACISLVLLTLILTINVEPAWNKTKTIGWKRYCEQYLKNNMEFSKYADKLSIKENVRKYNLPMKIPKTYASVTNADDITIKMIETLPNDYVFKANHGSSMTVMVKGDSFRCHGFCAKTNYSGSSKKLQLKFLRQNCHKWLSIDYSRIAKERFYSPINLQCFFEEIIPQSDEYKIYTFHGKPALFDVHKDRFKEHFQAFYTPSWHKVNMIKGIYPAINIEEPHRLKDMLQVAKQLSRGIPFVRVDLYVSEQDIVFSELTQTPAACRITFTPLIADKFYGSLADGINQDPETIISILK